MYLELKVSKETEPDLRREIQISVIIDDTEIKTMIEEGWAHLTCQTPLPIQIFQKSNPAIRTVASHATHEGKTLTAYFLPKAPKALMNRPIPRKTALKIPSKGTTTIGFVNPRDLNVLFSWWKKAQTEFLYREPQSPEKKRSTPQPSTFERVSQTRNVAITPTKTIQTQDLALSKKRRINILD